MKGNYINMEELDKVAGGLKPKEDGFIYYRCGDCGHEFKEVPAVEVTECPKCHGHWIGIHHDCF